MDIGYHYSNPISVCVHSLSIYIYIYIHLCTDLIKTFGQLSVRLMCIHSCLNNWRHFDDSIIW